MQLLTSYRLRHLKGAFSRVEEHPVKCSLPNSTGELDQYTLLIVKVIVMHKCEV